MLKRKKATGADCIPPGVLKDAARSGAKSLAHIINLSMNSSTIPADWKIAKVIPLHKHKETNQWSRTIDHISATNMFQIMVKAVHHQLIEYLESEELLLGQHYGYRKYCSNELASIHLTDNYENP